MARSTKLQRPETKVAAQPVTRRDVHPWVMRTALEAAGGDPKRLHFHEDGSVVSLNYVGQECPECARAGRQAEVKKPARKPRASSKKS